MVFLAGEYHTYGVYIRFWPTQKIAHGYDARLKCVVAPLAFAAKRTRNRQGMI